MHADPQAITDDDAASAIFTYLRAAQEGAARVNLRMMAEALVNGAQEATFAPDEFRRHAQALAGLSCDEVLMLAAFLRANRAAAAQPGGISATVEAPSLAWGAILSDPSQFPEGYDAIATVAALGRTGWVVPGSGWGSLTYFTTTAFDAISRLVDFELARAELKADEVEQA